MQNPFMAEALREARTALAAGEIPVGAVIVRNGEIISRGHNLRETEHNALLHAEIVVIDRACKAIGSWRLSDCDLYVTLEPCAMCAGAIAQAKLRRVYFGAYDPKGGFAVSNAALFSHPGLMHKPECYCGIMEEACSSLLGEFFDILRSQDTTLKK